MKTVVFGGSGFIGSHVADALSAEGHSVLVFDLLPGRYMKPGQEMMIGDVRDPAQVRTALKGADYVYDFAGIADLDDATTKPLETVTCNIEGTVNILEACRQEKIERFIYASTIYVYSEKGGFYRCSKQAAELYVEEYHRKYGIDYTILRYGTVYGPRAGEGNSVFRYLRQALQEGKISVSATGREVREYIYVGDAARLSVEILAAKHRNQHVIITGNSPMKFRDFLEMVKEILGNRVQVDFVDGDDKDEAHYNVTPYSFIPRIGYKFTSNCYLDMGQGLLECMNDISARMKESGESK